MAVRTKKFQIALFIIEIISIYVVNFQRNFSGDCMSFSPTTLLAP
jgi:hypothetical protein